MISNKNSMNLGRILKQQRLMIPLTLAKLATISGISSSHLGRIERGERFPSAHILRKMAKPLGFEEDELFTLAGYLSPQLPTIAESSQPYRGGGIGPLCSQGVGTGAGRGTAGCYWNPQRLEESCQEYKSGS